MFTLENIPIIRNATVCNRSQQIGSVVWTGPKTIKFQIVNFYFKFIYRIGPWMYLREFVKPSVENELKIFVKVYFYWLWNFLIKHIFELSAVCLIWIRRFEMGEKVEMNIGQKKFAVQKIWKGCGCGSVGRAVTFNTRDPRF